MNKDEILGIIIVSVMVFLFLYRIRPYSKDRIGKKSYYLRKSVFTPTELKYYHALGKYFIENDLQKKYCIFPKMRLIDIFNTSTKWNGNENKPYVYKILAKHIDFVITDKYGVPKLLIELDDRYHKGRKYYKNDTLKDDIAKNCGILLLRPQAANNYNFSALSKIL